MCETPDRFRYPPRHKFANASSGLGIVGLTMRGWLGVGVVGLLLSSGKCRCSSAQRRLNLFVTACPPRFLRNRMASCIPDLTPWFRFSPGTHVEQPRPRQGWNAGSRSRQQIRFQASNGPALTKRVARRAATGKNTACSTLHTWKTA